MLTAPVVIANAKTCRRIAQIILVCTAITILLTFQHYGITWDEELQSQYGLAVVDYYTSFFKDHRFDEIFNLHLYGGMFDGMASIIDRFTPFSVYETRHLVNAFVGLLGLWGTWRLGRLIGGDAVGLLALILLLATPMYYGHMYNNPKDIPFAAGIVWSIYYMGRFLADMPRVRWSLVIKLGIVFGLTLGVRVGGVMLLTFWLMLVGKEIVQTRGQGAKTIFLRVVVVGVIAYAVMLFCWPWAQENAILNPLRALSEFSNFPQDVEVLLDGVTYRSTQLPWYYVPVYFGVQLPELLLLLLGTFFICMYWIGRGLTLPQCDTLTLLLMMAFIPPLYAVIHHPALYDAVRHFLFTVPLFCVLAALAARHVYVWCVGQFWQNWSRRGVAAGLYVFLAIMLATQTYIMVRLHPYEYIYANRFAGGVQGIYGKYELDYWGSSFKEAVGKLQDFVANEGGVPDGKIYRIAICGPWDSAMIYLPPDYEPVVANEPAEFFLSTTRWMCQNMRPGREIIQVKRLGVPLAIIKDLRGGFEHYPGNEPPKQKHKKKP